MNLVLAISINLMLSSAQTSLGYEHAVSDALVNTLADTKLQVIQIQQYLTDASATGEQDGVEDGTQAYHSALASVQKIQQIDPSLTIYTDPLLVDIEALYQTGLKMVAAYKSSRKEGNLIMKSLDGFDQQTEKLQVAITQVQQQIDAKHTKAANEVNNQIRMSNLICSGMAITMILICVIAGKLMFDSVFKRLGGEPELGVEIAESLARGELKIQSKTQVIADEYSLIGHLNKMRALD